MCISQVLRRASAKTAQSLHLSCQTIPGNEVSKRSVIPPRTSYTKGVNDFDAVPRGLRKSYGVLLCCAYCTSQRHCNAADYVRVAATVVQ